jgi:two-component system phosphate regulon response regulator OmpR
MAKILVIEDDPDLRELFTDVLGRRHEVTASGTAADGLNVCRTIAFNAVVVDVTLPGESGTEFARELLTQEPSILLLFISGFPVNNWRGLDRENLEAIPVRSRAVLQKPFPPGQLDAAVVELLARSRANTAA